MSADVVTQTALVLGIVAGSFWLGRYYGWNAGARWGVAQTANRIDEPVTERLNRE
ncbi:hypothetical protein I5J42_gp76 [Mycobacterium phage GreaseLightnin]|uniref:Uncharacterized protein n=3 Tax=Caudoviricetes TaxID=2731619 RepID=A0A143FQ12_9CAUD|nr:hypothetical protein SEA_SHIPWRECK_77 [Mycobacterium phage Shipwreck]YP_009964564.1 hypothetical protein I5J42_gp76 [Mycobacterium phage GreaseLightnin]YP_009964722.1 hypothetical protein I5J44_gp74 [Mycobacterium phage Phineas]ASD53698.1 hypothetical protein SEA_BOGIE_77 [Mycobacterium phage Bogie]QDH85033.1 hypothetical protein SEA_HUHILLTOP_77 [Mycobacterium phage HUHilltop]QDH92953.1 hypothetical protein SEA_NECROPOLIS_72 [Mycobacterium phage Necropolis]UYL87599.1 membrane protein [Myc